MSLSRLYQPQNIVILVNFVPYIRERKFSNYDNINRFDLIWKCLQMDVCRLIEYFQNISIKTIYSFKYKLNNRWRHYNFYIFNYKVNNRWRHYKFYIFKYKLNNRWCHYNFYIFYIFFRIGKYVII